MNLVAELRLLADAAHTQREALQRLIFCAEQVVAVTFGHNNRVDQLRDAIAAAKTVLEQ